MEPPPEALKVSFEVRIGSEDLLSPPESPIPIVGPSRLSKIVVHPMPGHTPGSLAFLGGPFALVGDSILPRTHTSVPTGRLLQELEKSLEALAHEAGNARVLAGHGGVLGRAFEEVQRTKGALERRRESIGRILQEGERSAWEVVGRLWRGRPRDPYLALKTTLSFLEDLESRGVVQRRERHGVIFWSWRGSIDPPRAPPPREPLRAPSEQGE